MEGGRGSEEEIGEEGGCVHVRQGLYCLCFSAWLKCIR